MKQCPDCSYLVPDSWVDCRRCGAPLGSTPPAPAPVASSPSAAARTAADPVTTAATVGSTTSAPAAPVRAEAPPMTTAPAWTPPPRPPATAVASPFVAGAAPPPPRSAAPAPGGTAGTPTVPEPVLGGAAAGHPPPSPSIPGWAIVLVAVAAVIGAGWFTTRVLFAPGLPAAVAAYADGETSVAYTPPSGGYTAEFPSAPRHETLTLPVMGQSFAMEVAYSEQPDLLVAVMSMNLPPGAGLTPDLLLSGGAVGIDMVGGAEVSAQHETTHQGHAAMDVEVGIAEGAGKLRMIVVGDHLYAAIAATPGRGVDTAFDHLVDTLVVGV